MTYLDYVSLHCHSLQVCCRRGEGYYVNDIEGGNERGIQQQEEGSSSLVGYMCLFKQGDRIKRSRVSRLSRLSCHL
jgi:hypothetical protein